MKIDLYHDYGAILTQEECEIIKVKVEMFLESGKEVIFNFKSVSAMPTKGAKTIFGFLYMELGKEKFSKQIKFTNISSILTQIIYDALLDSSPLDLEVAK